MTDPGEDATQQLSDRLAAATGKAAAALKQLQQVAGRIADTEEHVADVLEDVAASQPERAEHLRAMAARARDFAAEERAVSEGRQR